MTDDVPRTSSYPILPPATRVRIHNRVERTLDAVNELLTSARDNVAALDAAVGLAVGGGDDGQDQERPGEAGRLRGLGTEVRVEVEHTSGHVGLLAGLLGK